MAQVSGYAQEAMRWDVEHEIINGKNYVIISKKRTEDIIMAKAAVISKTKDDVPLFIWVKAVDNFNGKTL